MSVEFHKDGMTIKGKVYGTECKTCGHRAGVHFFGSIQDGIDACDGYDEQCKCVKYVDPD